MTDQDAGKTTGADPRQRRVDTIAWLARAEVIAPLRESVFRTIWMASILSNFGALIQSVGAAWEMTRLTNSADKVALVQTAVMLPTMLVSLPAGAIADMYDRRVVALSGLGFAFACAALLTTCAWLGVMSPTLLLSFCFLIGSGVALFGPAWQSSVAEQVPAEVLPAAIALNSISYNIARSFGPAIGGLIVVAFGAMAAFASNALLYIPLVIALLFWRRERQPSRLPPERIGRALVSGIRYVIHSPPIRTVLTRTFVTGLAGASVSALMPLVARDLLHGNAGTYGLMLGAFGVGAVLGALFVGQVRRKLESEAAIRLCVCIMGAAMVIVGISRSPIVTGATLIVAGAVWMLAIALYNVGVQLSSPRWVAARTLASFQAAITGGIAIGAWIWGDVASAWGVGTALVASGVAMIVSLLIGLLLPMPRVVELATEAKELLDEPHVALALTPRSGPVVIEIDYRVDVDQARAFYGTMQKVQLTRQRTGAFEWSLSRDIADLELWTERFHCPTWLDYLRQRSRTTQTDRMVQDLAGSFHIGADGPQVRRRLERPFGSVRWRAESPDQGAALPIYAP